MEGDIVTVNFTCKGPEGEVRLPANEAAAAAPAPAPAPAAAAATITTAAL
jgi:hypothetical protein